MLSHVKYRNSSFTRIKKPKFILAPNVKKKNSSEYILSEKVYSPILLCFGVYTPTQYSLSCKIQRFSFYINRKKSKYYLGTPMLKAKLL